jgi:hypothetical protein
VGDGRRFRLPAFAAPWAGVLLALSFPAVAMAGQDPAPLTRPDAIQQPLDDGCHRNPAGFLAFTEPEWVFVYSHESFNPDPAKARVVTGHADFSDLAGGDLPESHNFYDFNTDVTPDGSYSYLVGGNPADHTGNFGDTGSLHVEWESGTLPKYAWINASDRVKLWGSWIWDCGHWEQGFTSDPNDPSGSAVHDTDYFLPGTDQTGTLRGEGTEFHPMQAVVAFRDTPFLPKVDETEADVFMSSKGTPAYAAAKCALEHPAPLPPASYGPDWVACANDPASERQPVNDRDYSFFVPAPPKPSPDATLRYRVEDVVHGNGPEEMVQPESDGIRVTVPFHGYGGNTGTLSYGKSFFVGWEGPVQTYPDQVRITLKKLTVHDSLDDPNPPDSSLGFPPGEYGLYLDINGDWTYLNDLAPGLGAVDDGQSFDLNHNVDIYVPASKALSLLVDGRECDLPKISPCPNTTEAAEDNDNPGTAETSFSSVSAALGDHTLTPASGHWDLTYNVSLLQSGGTQGHCFDTFLPRSRIARSGAHVVNGRFVFAGTAADRDCSGDGVAPRSVKVSVARVVPPLPGTPNRHHEHDRCQFLQRSGSFSKARSCQRIGFLIAHGASSWSFVHRANITQGDYLVRTRAVDRAGNVEYANLRRNRLVVSVP